MEMRHRVMLIALTAPAVPLAAQTGALPGEMRVGQTAQQAPASRPPVASVAHIPPLAPGDDRTPAQRCLDAEAARIGSPLTGLDLRTIDLKCSQR